jgi:restriction endonuclease Mrr
MPLVNIQPMLFPTLTLIAEGHSVEKIRERLKTKFQITPLEAEQTHARSGKNIFVNRVAWVFSHLVQGKVIALKSEGVYEITERGTELLSRRPSELTISDLH